MNSITIAGRVGRDAELKTTVGGTTLANFAVASSRKYNGEEKTTWFDCTLFGKRAESLAQYIKKGDQIAVAGSCELQTWVGGDGKAGAKISVNVNDVALMGGNSSNQQQPQQGYQQQPAQQQAPQQMAQPQQQQQQAPQGQSFDDFDDFDDDIPFR
jgi:single-strand DNA-binding protein